MILLLLYKQPILALVVALIAISIATIAMQQIHKRLVIVEFDGETLAILERQHRTTLTMPLPYKISVRQIEPGNNQPSRAYLQLVIFTGKEGLIFEELIPAREDTPHLPTTTTKLSFTRYRNLKPFPDALWKTVQKLGIPKNPDANLLIEPMAESGTIKQLFAIGKSHLITYEFEAALDKFDQIIALARDYPSAFYNRGIVYASDAQFIDNAISDFTHAISLDEQYLPAIKQRAKCYLTKQNWQQALFDASIVLLRTSDAELYNVYGVAYHALHLFDQALESYTEAITLDPNYARAYYNRGLLFQRIGNIQNANADFEHATLLDPTIRLK